MGYPRHALTLSLGLLAFPAGAEDLFMDSPALPEVLTATRLQQAAAAVPGSISVLDRELIQASGARTLPELLRLVPGMLVVPQVGNPPQTTVNYHGSSANQARRLQVLVDGRSVYRSGLAQVDWHDIPLAIEDIERIEVFRGPNTVSYGANALMAVVNILTRAPRDSHGTRLKVTRGQRGIDDWYAGHGLGWDGGDLHLSLSGQADDGFDHDRDGNEFRDGRRLDRLNLRLTQELDPSQSLDWQLALKEGSNQVGNHYRASLPITALPGEQDDRSDVRARDYAGSVRWNLDLDPQHSLHVQANLQHWERLRQWRACEAQVGFSPQLGRLWRLSPSYASALLGNLEAGKLTPPPGSTEQVALAGQVIGQVLATLDPTTGNLDHACGLINEDSRETRLDLEVQDTLSLSDSLRLLSGASYRHDRAESDTYLGAPLRKDTWRLFGHLEWHIDEHWLLQGGAMYERDSALSDSLTPRLALNYLITPAHGLRAVYSEALRTPDMFENGAHWSYRVRDLRTAAFGQREALFFMSTQAPGDLDQERIRSYELGYNGHFSRLGLAMDVKLFHENIDDMISEPLKVYDFTPSNANRLRLNGIEGELDWRLGSDDRLRLGYAYIEFDASHPEDRRLTPRHSGSAGWLRNWGQGWHSSLFYYGADSLNGLRFERLDLRLARRLHIAATQLELAGMLQQRLDDEPLSMPNNHYDARRVLWFSAGLEF